MGQNVPRGSAPLVVLLSALGFVAACTPAAAPAPAPAPKPLPPPRIEPVPFKPGPPTLPPIPEVSGPLQIRVVYPAPGHLIESRDSNYVFGSLGNGHATLTVNGTPARVYPNGAFMIWLANPPASAPHYDLVAAVGMDTARQTLPVRILPPRPVLADAGLLVVDSSSVAPRGTVWMRDDDPVRVSVRVPRNATTFLQTLTSRIDLLPNDGDSLLRVRDVPAVALRSGGNVVVIRGADTVRLPIASVAPPNPDGVVRAAIVKHSPTLPDTDFVISGRPVPGDTYRWFLMPDTKLEVTGRTGDYYRVRLDSALEIWVSAADVTLVAADPMPRRVAGNARVRASRDWVDVIIPIGARPAYFVEEGDRSIDLTLYDTHGNSDLINYTTGDSLVRSVEWNAPGTDRVRYVVQLSRAPFGYLVMYEGGNLVLRLHRPPVIDAAHPLAGRTITIDPGHPPEGSTGPTGLYEGDAVLAVGERVRALLEQRGAHVVMTRSTTAPVELALRPVIARRANADAFVSIHLNAYPDGIDPFTAKNGSGTYFYRTQSAPLARAMQRSLLETMGLSDEGYFFRSLAVVRHPWMPSVLTEGAFVIVPEQESALRTADFQTRYAEAIVEGLERYFRELGKQQ